MRKRLLFLCLFVLFVISELLARAYLQSAETPKSWIGEFDYLTSEFFQSTLGVQWQDRSGYMIPADHHSALYNFDNGMRRTIGQPNNPRHNVWLFGNSALFGYLVTDEQTIASQLQKLMPDYRVNNLGAITATAQQEALRLKDVPLAPGDIVIFYDGPVDAFTVYSTAAERSESFVCQRFRFLALVDVACKGTVPYLLYDKAWLNNEINNMQWRYRSALFEAKYIALQHGARFYHFLQPTIFSRPPAGREVTLSPLWRDGQPGLHDTYTAAWPLVQSLTRYMGDTDLTHVLDKNGESFFDVLHTMPDANKVIAEAMAAKIDGLKSP